MMKYIMIIQINMISLMSFISLLINLFPSHNKMINPIIMGMVLLILSLICSLIVELYMCMNWLSYLLFLIIIGGLMIIFLYFTSFISNMVMHIKFNYIKMLPIKFLMSLILLNLMFNFLLKNFFWYNNSLELMQLNFMNYKILPSTMYMFIYNKNIIVLISMIYLLLVLTLIVKMCINKKFTLRKLN